MSDLPAEILAWYAKIPGPTPALERFTNVVVFAEVHGDRFGAGHQAAQVAADAGLSAGSMQSGSPQGLFHGAGYVSKWQGLSAHDRAQLDGMILGGDHGCGPCAIVTLRPLSEYGEVSGE